MEPDTLLDYALFQLSPKRTRCELFVTTDGKTEKLASGLVKPFVSHLKVAEEQVASAVHSIKLDVGRQSNAQLWFTKGTLERFVRFVSTPEVMELANTYDAEMSQLESARRIYSQGLGDHVSRSDNGVSSATTAADATKKELLRAIDVRLAAVQQDLIIACSRATAAGFNLETVSKLQKFSDQFGAHRLNEACSKFMSLCNKRPDVINQWKAVGADEDAVRSSYGSDMSLDEDPTTPEQHPINQEQAAMDLECSPLLDQSSSSINEEPKSSSIGFHLRQSRESSIEPEDKSREKNGDSSSDQTEPTPTSRHVRRLSVQDRINLFENKQKENSGSGGKPIVGKPVELRRLSSDVSVAQPVVEKSVLRRWSGASDMSIDLSCEKKDGESPVCTPSSAFVSKSKTEDQARLDLTDMASKSGNMEFQSVPDRVSDISVKEHRDLKLHIQHANEREELRQLTTSYKKVEDSDSSNSSTAESDGRKDNIGENAKSNLYSTRSENSLKERLQSEGLFGSLPWDKTIKVNVATQVSSTTGSQGSNETFEPKKRAVHGSDIASLKEENSLLEQFGASASHASYIRPANNAHHHPVLIMHHNQEEETQPRDHMALKSRFKAPQKSQGDFGPLESGSISRSSFTPQGKRVEGDSSYSLSRSQPSMETEDAEKVKVDSSKKIDGNFGSKVDNSGFPIRKFKKKVVGADVNNNSQVFREETTSGSVNNKLIVSASMVEEVQEGSVSFLPSPAQQVQRVRQPKGNQDLNDELKIKAKELEKLFAEHKQRAPGDHSNPARRSRPAEIPAQCQVADNDSIQFPDKSMLNETAESSSSMVISDSTVMEIGDGKGCTDVLNKNLSELGSSEGSRGKYYDKYMQIRDAKLREEWSSKRDEKEAKLKAMQDSLEKTSAKMKAKFSGSSHEDGSISTARRRADRLKSFDSRSILRREKQHLDFDQHDEDKIRSPEQKQYGEGRYSNETSDAFFEDDVSTSSQEKKLLLAKVSSTSTPRTTTAPVPRSAVKATNSNPGRRRFQSENPLAQSVPNFSDMKKENTKLSSAGSKTARSQLKSYARSKNASEETPIKEEKSSRSQQIRKSTANLGVFTEASVLNSEDVLTLKNEEIVDKVRKNVDSRPLHKKGRSTDINARVGVPKKSSKGSETMNSDEEYNDAVFVSDNPMNLVKDGEDIFENAITEHSSNLDNGDSRLSHESGKSADFESENGNLVRSFSHYNTSLASESPAIAPSRLDSQDTPGESPVSWISRAHHPFSYSHEMSDVDASVDSPLGSPASWNSHSLSQTEADAARMRKKWGAAQKPMLVSTSSQNLSRKDMTRGFKRLLKFGRKSRGTESFVDWISATTSEGDDDTEDGRDPPNRISDDLRKSRMSFLQGHPSDDSFNEHEFISEPVQSMRGSIPAPPANFKLRDDHLSGSSSLKAPRSFFSLSTFRNKGTDSKLR